jgi:radical SAM-linked protein
MRIRLEYKKIGSLIFISTLDIERMWERVLRRSGLKLKYTEGYNPKIIKDFSPAIPLGIYSESELLDFIITENLNIDSILEKIKKVSPFDLFIKRAKEIDENSPSLSSIISHIKIEIIGEDIKKIKFSELNFEKVINGKTKIVQLNKYIYKEEINENGKILIVDSKVSLKDIVNNLNKTGLKFLIIKRENYILQNDKLISIFDLN